MWDQQHVETARGTFEIFIKGNGAPICVTHLYSAYNANGNTFANAFTDYYTVYLVNLRGAGKSAKYIRDEDLSIKESIGDLEAIREALHFEKWAFAGHSTGGMLGLVYAIQTPRSLTKIVIGGASASKEYMNHPGSIYCKDNPNNKRLLEILSILNSPTSANEIKRAAGREWTEMSIYHPEKYEEYFNTPNSGSVVPARLNYYSYSELPNYDLVPHLKTITVPTTVYCGSYDAQCPYLFSEQIAHTIPNANLFTFRESNHFPFTEEPQKFLDMIARTI
ncbi:alpha/beta hydrolase [Paenisporosarcina sp. FSL H8-0542]|uniref:alpha/beta fold hydrolase n=1 Tax=Paenisporosarcina sp. FSL H8-0542 TaxID=2921401 RepID=UPI003159C4B1